MRTAEKNRPLKGISLAAGCLLLLVCGCHAKQKPFTGIAQKAKRAAIIDKYPKIPHDEILQQIAGNRLYSELEERYRKVLGELKTAADNDCAHIVVVIMTPDVGKFTTLSNTYGIPYIIQSCNLAGIDCVNLAADIAAREEDPNQIPDDGNWSKPLSASLASLLEGVVTRYNAYESSKKFPEGGKPATFGDLPPKDDEVIDGEKSMQYRLTVNAQGLRMDHNLSFPKQKQTVLLLGGTQLYSPYLDNNFTAAALLQKMMPDKEIVNAGNLNYTLDDFLSLYQEKARFTEPDLIIICTNGDDILNFFFSQRNRYSRITKQYDPSDVEKEFYDQTFN
jgi:hypothetical protein